MSTVTILFQHNARSSRQCSRLGKERTYRLKQRSNTVLSADDMIVYIKNPKESTRKLLEPESDFSKVIGYKINILKSILFLYTVNEHVELK